MSVTTFVDGMLPGEKKGGVVKLEKLLVSLVVRATSAVRAPTNALAERDRGAVLFKRDKGKYKVEQVEVKHRLHIFIMNVHSHTIKKHSFKY